MAKAKATKSAAFVNPFDKGVTYKDLLAAMKGKTPAEYLKGKCTTEQIEYIKTELKQYKAKK